MYNIYIIEGEIMGFWIFMLIMDLLIPLILILFGSYFKKKVPKKMNCVYGYRTSMSMKNKDTWKFAHQYFGKLWSIIGWMLIPISIISMFFAFNKNVEFIGIFGGVLCGVQSVIMIVSIFPTEIALKRTFDQHGHRRK